MKRLFLTVGAITAPTVFFSGCGPSGAHFQDVKTAVLSEDETVNMHVEVSLGVFPIWLVGEAARFIDEPEVREARQYAKHIRHVDVGVYQVQEPLKPRFASITRRVQSRMLHHGFEPLVQVREKDQCVTVYASSNMDGIPAEFFVVVMEQNQRVLVRVRGNFEKLARAALKNHPLDLPALNRMLEEQAVL